MPIYEYQCQDCQYRFEEIQKFSDEPFTTCPKCNQKSLKKLLNAPSFQLKGSGWYVTDFRDNNKPKETKKNTEGETKANEQANEQTNKTEKTAEKPAPNNASSSPTQEKPKNPTPSPKTE